MRHRLLLQQNPYSARRKYRRLMTGAVNRISGVIPVARIKKRLYGNGHGNRIIENFLVRNITFPRVHSYLVRNSWMLFR